MMKFAESTFEITMLVSLRDRLSMLRVMRGEVRVKEEERML